MDLDPHWQSLAYLVFILLGALLATLVIHLVLRRRSNRPHTRHAWRDALPGVDAVCHQAARVGLGVDFGDVGRYVADNDVGTAAGLGVLHELGFAGRLVLAGSMVVYGEGRYLCPEHGRVQPGPRRVADLEAGRFDPPCAVCGRPVAWVEVVEVDATDPRNVYAATKLHQEHLCAAFGREHGVPVTALRYHNVYGPRMPRDTPYAGVASIFRSALERGEPPQVFEDGGQQRDFVHVADVARANLDALFAPEPHLAESLAKRHGAPSLETMRLAGQDGRALADTLRAGQLPVGIATAQA